MLKAHARCLNSTAAPRASLSARPGSAPDA
jgi:hypothetical protein